MEATASTGIESAMHSMAVSQRLEPSSLVADRWLATAWQSPQPSAGQAAKRGLEDREPGRPLLLHPTLKSALLAAQPHYLFRALPFEVDPPYHVVLSSCPATCIL